MTKRAAAVAIMLLGLAVGLSPVQDAQAQIVNETFVAIEAEPADVTVVSGDTIDVGDERVRIYGIDAPQPGQPCFNLRGVEYDCGNGARNALTFLLRDKRVRCQLYATRSDGVQIGNCFVGNADIGAAMLVTGWAVSQRGLSDRYEFLESQALANKRGLWAGIFTRPAYFARQEAANAPIPERLREGRAGENVGGVDGQDPGQ